MGRRPVVTGHAHRGSRAAGTYSKGGVFTAPATPTKAQRAQHVPVPQVNPRSVACPECKAEVDDPCISLGMRQAPKGEPVVAIHRSRKRIATRRFN